MGFQETMKALSDKTRRDILMMLKDKKMTAGEIVDCFNMTGATVSHHLSILKEAGLVRTQRQGKYIYCEINLSVMEEIITWINNFGR